MSQSTEVAGCTWSASTAGRLTLPDCWTAAVLVALAATESYTRGLRLSLGR